MRPPEAIALGEANLALLEAGDTGDVDERARAFAEACSIAIPLAVADNDIASLETLLAIASRTSTWLSLAQREVSEELKRQQGARQVNRIYS